MKFLTCSIHEIIKANARDGFRDGQWVRKDESIAKAVESALKGVEQDKLDDIMQLIVAQKEY